MKWEYLSARVRADHLDEELNQYGEKGWDAFSVIPLPPLYVDIIFRRPKPESSNE